MAGIAPFNPNTNYGAGTVTQGVDTSGSATVGLSTLIPVAKSMLTEPATDAKGNMLGKTMIPNVSFATIGGILGQVANNPKMMAQLYKDLVYTGKISKSAGASDVLAAYQEVLESVAKQNQSTGTSLTPSTYLDQLVQAQNQITTASGGLSGGTATKTLDPTDARYLVNSVYQNELGRDATDQEYRDFASAAQNQINTGDLGSSDATALEQVGSQQAKQSSDYAEYQGAETYLPALLRAMQGVGPGIQG